MASTYLTNTATTPTDQKKLTISAWVKRGNLSSSSSFGIGGFVNSGGGGSGTMHFRFKDDSFNGYYYDGSITRLNLTTNRLFRDTSAWYHIVLAVDTTQATTSDRVKIYVNGVQETSFLDSDYPDQNINFLSSGDILQVGRVTFTGNQQVYYDGSIAHYHFIDGTAYAASDFGETDATTGIWKPKTAPSVSYGSNGFFLKFENSGSMGTDSSGNGNNFTVNGTMTQTLDTPSNVFATMNPLIPYNTASAGNGTFSNGNNSVSYSTTYGYTFGTLGVSKGKYYWEVKTNITGSSNGTGVGFQDMDNLYNPTTDPTSNVYVYGNTGNTRSPAGDGTSYGDSYTTSTIGVALDLDNGKAYFSKDGTWQNSGDPTSGATGTGAAFSFTVDGTYVPYSADDSSGTTSVSYDFNFGNGYFGTTPVSSAQNPDDGIGIFEYDVPAGYRALCTKSINAQEYS